MGEEYKVDNVEFERPDVDNVERPDDVDSYNEYEESARAAVVSTPEVTNNVYLTLGYENTDFEREYKFSNVSNEALSSIASNVMAYNANVPAQDKQVFVSDEGDNMTSIVSAKVEQVTTTYIIKR